MIVADNTLLCHFFLRSELEDLAQRIREEDGDWIVPSLWRAEFANVVVKSSWLCPDPLESYFAAWEAACAVMSPCERPVDIREVLRLGVERHITAYDAHYVHLAMRFNALLVTEDRKLQRAFPDLALSMAAFLRPHGDASMVRERRTAYRTPRRRRTA
jgi:predicted nucleic acid-binding protein